MSHPLTGIQVHIGTINSDDVRGGFRIATISKNSNDVGEEGFAPATNSMTYSGRGFALATI